MVKILFFLYIGLQAIELDQGIMDGYLSIDEAYNYMKELCIKYPSLVSPLELGLTFGKHLIKGLKITNHLSTEDKGIVIISAGQIGGIPISTTAALYTASRFLASNSINEKELSLNTTEIYIFPLMNPDGYFYSQSLHYAGNRFVQVLKNTNFTDCLNLHSNGVRLNRNWGYMWNITGVSSRYGCNNMYPGTNAFSEIETYSIKNFFEGKTISAWLHYENTGNTYIVPFTYSQNKLNFDEDLDYLYNNIKNSLNNEWKMGTSYDVLGYTEDGSLLDWNANQGTLVLQASIGKTLPIQTEILSEIKPHYDIALEIIKMSSSNITLLNANSSLIPCQNDCIYKISTFEIILLYEIANYGISSIESMQIDLKIINNQNRTSLWPQNFKAEYKNMYNNNTITINHKGILKNSIYSITNFFLPKLSIVNITILIASASKYNKDLLDISTILNISKNNSTKALISKLDAIILPIHVDNYFPFLRIIFIATIILSVMMTIILLNCLLIKYRISKESVYYVATKTIKTKKSDEFGRETIFADGNITQNIEQTKLSKSERD